MARDRIRPIDLPEVMRDLLPVVTDRGEWVSIGWIAPYAQEPLSYVLDISLAVPLSAPSVWLYVVTPRDRAYQTLWRTLWRTAIVGGGEMSLLARFVYWYGEVPESLVSNLPQIARFETALLDAPTLSDREEATAAYCDWCQERGWASRAAGLLVEFQYLRDARENTWAVVNPPAWLSGDPLPDGSVRVRCEVAPNAQFVEFTTIAASGPMPRLCLRVDWARRRLTPVD